MEVLEITKDDFAPFGEILTMENPPAVNIENEFDWHTTAESIRLNKFCCTGLLNCRSREKEVVKMECHKKHQKFLVPSMVILFWLLHMLKTALQEMRALKLSDFLQERLLS